MTVAKDKLSVDTATVFRIGTDLAHIGEDHDTKMAEIRRSIMDLEGFNSFGNDEAGKALRQAYEQPISGGESLIDVLKTAMADSGGDTAAIGQAILDSAKTFARAEQTDYAAVARVAADVSQATTNTTRSRRGEGPGRGSV
jgi:hypothetical protein